MCALEDEPLHRLAEKTRVVIATVGPYEDYGEPMLAACANTGTHYLDWYVAAGARPAKLPRNDYP